MPPHDAEEHPEHAADVVLPVAGGRELGRELREDLLEHRLQERLLVRDVAVEGHRLHPKLRPEAPHREAVQAVPVDHGERGDEDPLTGEVLAGHRGPFHSLEFTPYTPDQHNIATAS